MITFTLSWPLIVGLLVSVVAPLLVGLVTTRVTSPAAKAIILAGIAAAVGVLTELGDALTNGTTYDIGTGLLLALAAFLVATGLHFGIYKPTGASRAVQDVGVTPSHR